MMSAWARRWGTIVALATLLNLALWWGWIGPQRARLQRWRQARQLAELRPTLEALVAQSDQVVQGWRRGCFPSGDPQAAMQTLQKIADRYRVRVSALNAQTAGGASAPIELEAGGSFHQLARWIGALESVSGLQLEQWTLTAAAEPGQPHQATLSLSTLASGT